MSIDNSGDQQQQSDATNDNISKNNVDTNSQNTQYCNGVDASDEKNDVVFENCVDNRLTNKEEKMTDSENILANGSTSSLSSVKSDKESDSSFVIHNNLYPSACSNTVTLTSISTKKPNVTSIEMRSSGTVPKKADIHNYFSTATLLVGKK